MRGGLALVVSADPAGCVVVLPAADPREMPGPRIVEPENTGPLTPALLRLIVVPGMV